MTSADPKALLIREDFGQAMFRPNEVKSRLVAFHSHFISFMEADGRPLDLTYLSEMLARLVRTKFSLLSESPNEAVARRQRMARERKRNGSNLIAGSGKKVTTVVQLECELLYFLLWYGERGPKQSTRFRVPSKGEKPFMSKRQALRLLALWELILGITDDGTRNSFRLGSAAPLQRKINEDLVTTVANRLNDNFKGWDPRQQSLLPKGYAIFSGRRASRSVVRFNDR